MHFEPCASKTCLFRSCKHASNVARVVETHTGTPCLNPPQSHSPCPFCRAVWHHRLTRKSGLPPFERSTSEILLTTGCSKITSLSCSICSSISGLVPLICSQVTSHKQVRRRRQGLSPSVTSQKSGSTSAPADAQSKHLPHACSMLAACLQLVAHTNKSSEHLLLVELQPCHMFPGRRQAGHTGCRSEGCFWARCWYRQALHRVQCRGPRCLRRGERLIILHLLLLALSRKLFHCFVFLTGHTVR